jgi:hypothetical protein
MLYEIAGLLLLLHAESGYHALLAKFYQSPIMTLHSIEASIKLTSTIQHDSWYSTSAIANNYIHIRSQLNLQGFNYLIATAIAPMGREITIYTCNRQENSGQCGTTNIS